MHANKKKAATDLLRCLQAKWESIDGHSLLREGWRQQERERKTKEEAQRKRLLDAAEAKRLAEEALNRRLRDETQVKILKN